MKNYEKLIWQSLLVLLGILLCAAIFTRDWANYRDRLRALRAKSQHAQLVDTRPLDTAQQLGALAVMRTEHDYAQDAERLADRSVDLAFAIAIHDAGRNPAPLTPQTRQLTERIKAGETAVTGDQSRVTQFTQLLAKTSNESAKADLQGLLVTAQAQLALDQDDLDAAKQDLVLAGETSRRRFSNCWTSTKLRTRRVRRRQPRLPLRQAGLLRLSARNPKTSLLNFAPGILFMPRKRS